MKSKTTELNLRLCEHGIFMSLKRGVETVNASLSTLDIGTEPRGFAYGPWDLIDWLETVLFF